ncbi:MAG: hypothetical protein LW595_06705 [Rickettsiales bacterium]|nr:hypothetical protein [Rickettsiales bacterium]
MTEINSKLMIDYDDNNSYLDFITEKGIEYYIKSIVERYDYLITYTNKSYIKPVFIQQKPNNGISKVWEYSDKLAEFLGLQKPLINDFDELKTVSMYWLAINTIEEKIQEHITNSYQNGWITNKECEEKLNYYEDNDITHTIENIQNMIEKEYGENATLAEIKKDSEYHYNLLIASTYLRNKHNL